MTKHPNAKVAGGTTLFAAGLVELAAYFGLELGSSLAVIAAGGLITIALWIGRARAAVAKHGLVGFWHRLKHGFHD